jgi:hypothetical protein
MNSTKSRRVISDKLKALQAEAIALDKELITGEVPTLVKLATNKNRIVRLRASIETLKWVLGTVEEITYE